MRREATRFRVHRRPVRREEKSFLFLATSWILILILLMSILHAAGMKPYEWEFDRKLANTGYARYAKVALSEDTIHMAYFDSPALDESLYAYEQTRLLYARSDDYGRSWSEHVLCSVCNVFPESAAISSSGNWVYVAWSVKATHSRYDVKLSVSHDRGTTWNDPVTLATDHRDDIGWLEIQSENQLVYVTYATELSTYPWKESLFMVSSANGGLNWSEVQVVPEEARAPYGARLVDGVLYLSTCVEWGENNPSYLLSTSNLGATWTSSVIGSPLDSGVCAHDMEVVDGRIAVLSHEGYTSADLASLNWSRHNPNATGYKLLQSNGTLLAFNSSSDDGMYVQLGSDKGDVWGEKSYVLVFDENNQRVNDVASFGSDVVLVWVERREPDEIRSEEVYLKISHDSGATWSEPIRATDRYNELAVPLFAITVGLFFMVTWLTVWSWRELARARREKPLLLWPSERIEERKSSASVQKDD